MLRRQRGAARQGSRTSSSAPTRSISSRIVFRKSRSERTGHRRRKRKKTVGQGSGTSPCCRPSASNATSVCSAAGESVQRKEEEPTAGEKALLREEFLSQMYQHFLDGKDRDFNYRFVPTTALRCPCRFSLIQVKQNLISFKYWTLLSIWKIHQLFFKRLLSY